MDYDYRSFVDLVAEVVIHAKNMTDDEWTLRKNQVIKEVGLKSDEFTEKLLEIIDKYRHNLVVRREEVGA